MEGVDTRYPRVLPACPGVAGSGTRSAQDSVCVLLLTLRKEDDMPKGQHVKGVGPKEQREYEHIKESAEKSGRYGDRAEEVAARTVLKHHKQEGHKKGE